MAADIDGAIHFHSLRHSFASNLAQKGVSLYVIKELLGHSSITTTEIYSHLNMDSLREAVGKLDDRSQISEYRSDTADRSENAKVRNQKLEERPLDYARGDRKLRLIHYNNDKVINTKIN